MPDDIITNAFKSMFPELKRHLDMTTLRHWSKKIAIDLLAAVDLAHSCLVLVYFVNLAY